MTFKPPFIHRPPENVETHHVYYEYLQQPEIIEEISKQIKYLLKNYENREDIEIYLANEKCHPIDERDCLSLRLQIIVKPRKEMRIR